MNVKFRQRVERLIARRFIVEALGAGYLITVNDGEENVLTRSDDHHAVLAAMFTTDDNWLFVTRGTECGWVRFIYGNHGYDVIHDYTTNLEPLMPRVTAAADRLEEIFA